MKKYTYKSGEEVKENDICFYSEYVGKNKGFHYADGISRMEMIEGELRPRTYVFTMDEARSFKNYNEPDEHTVPLEFCCNMFRDKTILENFTKIGEGPKDDHMLTEEYATQNYKIDHRKK